MGQQSAEGPGQSGQGHQPKMAGLVALAERLGLVVELDTAVLPVGLAVVELARLRLATAVEQPAGSIGPVVQLEEVALDTAALLLLEVEEVQHG